MLKLIHVMGMKKSLKNQYQNASNKPKELIFIICTLKMHKAGFLGSMNNVTRSQETIFWNWDAVMVLYGQKTFLLYLLIYISHFQIFLKGCCVIPAGVSVQKIPALILILLIVVIFHMKITALTWFSPTMYFSTVMILLRYAER